MKNIGIITIIDKNNYGNRLQNYATQEAIKKLKLNFRTIKNDVYLNNKEDDYKRKYIFQLKRLKRFIRKNKRKKLFDRFDRNITFSKNFFNYFNTIKDIQFDYLLIHEN